MPFCGSYGSQLLANVKFCGNCGVAIGNMPPLTCRSCGKALSAGTKFCPDCGILNNGPIDAQQIPPSVNVTISSNDSGPLAKGQENEQETEYYRGEGELIIKRTEHRGAARKVMGIAAGLPTLGIGYLIIGKDKTRKSKAEDS